MPFSQNFTFNELDPDALLTERQAASLLNMSMRTLQDWRLKRKGPIWVKCGIAVRYRRRDLLSFIDENCVHPISLCNLLEMIKGIKISIRLWGIEIVFFINKI